MPPRRADGNRSGEGGQTWASTPGEGELPMPLGYAYAAPDVTRPINCLKHSNDGEPLKPPVATCRDERGLALLSATAGQ